LKSTSSSWQNEESPLGDFKDFVVYVTENYRRARKIVEVGIGRFKGVALEISRSLPNVELAVVDNDPQAITDIKRHHPALNAIIDDLRRPTFKIYEGADLIYSIRCPPEILPYLIRLANASQADLIVLPLHEDAPGPSEFQLMTFGRARFYLKRCQKR
jgi:hypothetical protein